eukprot:Hpha_TRINITY_DN166_c0_g1::TRINITY_DN166_c0_g1_i1::g.82313::m.82313
MAAPAAAPGPPVSVRVSYSGLAAAAEQAGVPAATLQLLRKEVVEKIRVPPRLREANGCSRFKSVVWSLPSVAAVVEDLQRHGVHLRMSVLARGQVVAAHHALNLEAGDAVHCVFALAPVGAADAGGRAEPPSPAPAPRGFDRLAEMGFSAEDIALMRDQFAVSQGASMASRVASGVDQLIALEEAWLAEGDNSIVGPAGGAA